MSKLSLSVQDLPKVNEPAARALDGITRSLAAATIETVKLVFLSGSWKHLGYQTFEAYMAGMPKYQLSRDERRAVVLELDGLGMRQRQIAAVVGAGKSTVARDLGPNGPVVEQEPAQKTTVADPTGPTKPDPFEAFVDSVQTPESRHASQVAQLTVAAQAFALAVDRCDEPPTDEEARLPSVTVAAALKRLHRGRKSGLEVVS